MIKDKQKEKERSFRYNIRHTNWIDKYQILDYFNKLFDAYNDKGITKFCMLECCRELWKKFPNSYIKKER